LYFKLLRFNRIHSSALAVEVSVAVAVFCSTRWTCQWAVLVSNKLQRSSSVVVPYSLNRKFLTYFSQTGTESVLITCTC